MNNVSATSFQINDAENDKLIVQFVITELSTPGSDEESVSCEVLVDRTPNQTIEEIQQRAYARAKELLGLLD